MATYSRATTDRYAVLGPCTDRTGGPCESTPSLSDPSVVADGDATLFPHPDLVARMKDYIVDEEEQLSPVVVATTVLLVAVFALGLLYQVVTFLV